MIKLIVMLILVVHLVLIAVALVVAIFDPRVNRRRGGWVAILAGLSSLWGFEWALLVFGLLSVYLLMKANSASETTGS